MSTPPRPNLFDVLDVNQDDVLTPEEILAHFRRHKQRVEVVVRTSAGEKCQARPEVSSETSSLLKASQVS